MRKILSIENALCWSWGIVFRDMCKRMKDYKIVRITRKLRQEIDSQLLNSYELIMAQNIDNMSLIKHCREKVVVRMGGMVLNDKSKGSRYDKELSQVGAVIATNQQLGDIAERVNTNVHVIPNGVDLEMFKPVQRGEKDFTVGFAGNIWGMGGAYKGWQFYVGATLSLYGQVKKKECLHNGPSNQEQLKHEEMAEKFYHHIDCLILPSEGEGCSNVVSEALACGVPVLITKVGYHGEMLRDMEDCIFIKRDVQDIYDKILMLKKDPELWKKLSENGRKFAEKYQSVDKIAIAYDKVFKTILE